MTSADGVTTKVALEKGAEPMEMGDDESDSESMLTLDSVL
jgi:hypothetical protein